MTSDELLEVINSWENLAFTIKEIENHPEHFHTLMEIALNGKSNKSWRAAWMADKIHDKNPGLLLPYIDGIIKRVKIKIDGGRLRHFLKLLSMHPIPEAEQSFFLDFCLNLLTSDKEPPAIRVHAMQILYNLSESEPDLKPEILAVIENEIELHSTPGIISRGTKLVRKLRLQTAGY